MPKSSYGSDPYVDVRTDDTWLDDTEGFVCCICQQNVCEDEVVCKVLELNLELMEVEELLPDGHRLRNLREKVDAPEHKRLLMCIADPMTQEAISRTKEELEIKAKVYD